MKKSLFLALVVASAAIMSSCSKLGNLSADNFKVNPTPLEAIGGEVPATINGIFPEKYMKKKAVVTGVSSLEESGIVNQSRYRSKNIPTAGAILKEEDAQEKQITLDI